MQEISSRIRPGQPRVASLTIIAGPDAGRSCDLLPECVLVVGREPTCGLQLSDPGVSRIHCRLFADSEGVRLEDVESRYGTSVNRRPVTIKHLQAGDTIEIGDTELRFDYESSIVATRPPESLVEHSSQSMMDQSITDGKAASRDVLVEGVGVNDLVGTTFVRFRVDSLVARGTTGVVYRAFDTIHCRSVALKVFSPALFAGDLAMSRFLRAMQAMVPLSHEHLIKVYTAGRSAGLCFTASEFVAGETAAQLIHRVGIAGMLDWRMTWRIALGLTEALVYLHDRQILHRSVKPGNIYIRKDDGSVKLGDSLLAKSLDQLGLPPLTIRGDIVGDINYAPPEQLQDGMSVNHQADIYSLGATLYALLTGRPPFVGGPADVIRQIQTKQPEPPKLLHLSIPAAFEGIVLRMLAKRPEDRYFDAPSLLNELQRVGRYEGLS